MRVLDKSVFHRIVPTIRDVIVIIGRVPDVVLPKSSLPNAAFAPCFVAGTLITHRNLT